MTNNYLDSFLKLKKTLESVQRSYKPTYSSVLTNYQNALNNITPPNVNNMNAVLNQVANSCKNIQPLFSLDAFNPLFATSLELGNAVSQLNFEQLFRNAKITSEYVELDATSSASVENILNTISEKPKTLDTSTQKLRKKFSISDFLALISILMQILQFLYPANQDLQKLEQLEQQQVQQQIEQQQSIDNLVSQLSELSSQLDQLKLSAPQEYSQEQSDTTSVSDKDDEAHSKQ